MIGQVFTASGGVVTGGGGGVTRRALEISGSTGTLGDMTRAAGTPGITEFTWSGWVYVNTGHPDFNTIFAGPSGTVQIYTGNTNTGQLLARGNGSSNASTITNAYTLDTWFHLHVFFGTNIGGSGDAVRIYINGTDVASTPLGALGSTVLDGTWYMLGDDGSDGDFDGRVFDAAMFSSLIDVSDRNQSAGAWADFGDTTGLITRLDGQTSADATQDSSGNSNHWTQVAGGGSVVTSETSLPSGANP